MPKRKEKIESRQGSLLDLLMSLQSTPEPRTEGSLDVAEKLRLSIIDAIKQSPLSRWEIAGKMGELLGRDVSKFQLDAWTAESKEAYRFPAEYLPAFCSATGSQEPLRLLAQAAGMFALPGPDALRAEIQRLEEEERRIKGEKHKRKLFLKEMES
jgi:hypothetical protein